MRSLIFILTYITTLFSNQQMYELQLYASKTDDMISMNKIIEKASQVDLSCLIVKKGEYSLVKCDQNRDWKEIQHSATKAKKANLEYFILNMKEDKEKNQKISTKIEKRVKKVSDIQSVEDQFFSDNSQLINILYNQESNSKIYLNSKKEQYLKNIATINSFNGAYFKGRTSTNLNKKKLDYDLKFEWNILNDGYIGSKKEAQNEVLKKELDYNRLLDEINSANLEISLYKIDAINNFINYQFSKHKEIILHDTLEKEQKKYKASLITSAELNRLAKSYEATKQLTDYYALLEHQKYDYKMRNFIKDIENLKLTDKDRVVNEAFSNSFLLQRSKNQISKAQNIDTWSDEVKTNIYIEHKKQFFLDSSDTIAGVQVQIPLYFNDDKRDEIKKIEIEATKIKENSIKKIISQNISDTYQKISYYKTNIKTLQEELKYYQDKKSAISLKLKYPLPSQKEDFTKKLTEVELSIVDISQKIWEQRTQIVKELLKIQYISGIQVLNKGQLI